MAKKVVWTQAALLDRFEIYQFWAENNQSEIYSEKLEKLFNDTADLIGEFPELGIQTDAKNIRVQISKSYKLFYKVTDDSIQILRVWDSRQDSNDLNLR